MIKNNFFEISFYEKGRIIKIIFILMKDGVLSVKTFWVFHISIKVIVFEIFYNFCKLWVTCVINTK